jgi:hypothetical protein
MDWFRQIVRYYSWYVKLNMFILVSLIAFKSIGVPSLKVNRLFEQSLREKIITQELVCSVSFSSTLHANNSVWTRNFLE